MYKTLTTTTLIASNILLDFLIQAIIVESNLHSYYRLSTTTVKTSNDSEIFFILQCPYKSSVNIPKPKDMPLCVIVGRYSENEEKQKELIKAKPRTTLNTKVDYRHLRPPKLVKLVKIKNGKPYTLLLKPVEKKKMLYKKPKAEFMEQYETTNVKFILSSPTIPTNQSTVLYSVPLIQKLHTNDTLALDSSKKQQEISTTVKPLMALEHDFPDDSQSEEDTQPAGSLKYLGVQDALKKLQSSLTPNPLATNQTQFKAEKFFADSENYKKGFRTKNFQNMYHRDEIYQDHIFYDDLQQMGNYRINQKSQQKQP